MAPFCPRLRSVVHTGVRARVPGRLPLRPECLPGGVGSPAGSSGGPRTTAGARTAGATPPPGSGRPGRAAGRAGAAAAAGGGRTRGQMAGGSRARGGPAPASMVTAGWSTESQNVVWTFVQNAFYDFIHIHFFLRLCCVENSRVLHMLGSLRKNFRFRRRFQFAFTKTKTEIAPICMRPSSQRPSLRPPFFFPPTFPLALAGTLSGAARPTTPRVAGLPRMGPPDPHPSPFVVVCGPLRRPCPVEPLRVLPPPRAAQGTGFFYFSFF